MRRAMTPPNKITAANAGWRPQHRFRGLHPRPGVAEFYRSTAHCALLAGFLATQPQLLAQEKPRNILPDDPTKAWAEVERVHQALRAPDAWRTHAPTAEQVAQFQER